MREESSLEKNSPDKLLIIFVIAAIFIPLFYSLYTHNLWEDFFTTFRHSKNLAEGKGLVYNPGERVHGFTSPIGVLLLAFSYLLTGKSSFLAAVWLYRVISIIAFTGAGIFLLLSFKENIKESFFTIFLAILYLFETKSVMFSSNGMETAFMLFFIAWFIFLSSQDLNKNWLMEGICWAGLLWTRLDGFIYILSLSLANLIFNQRPRKETLITLLKSAGICLILYLPWFFWAWCYYGSPIPNTVQAKSIIVIRNLNSFPWGFLKNYFSNPLLNIFGPVFYPFGDSPYWMRIFSYFLSVFSLLYWLLPLKDRLGRMISCSFFLITLYFFFLFILISPWYYPPVAMLGLFVLVRGFYTLYNLYRGRSLISKIIPGILGLITTIVIYIFILTLIQVRIQQKEVEFGNRQQIGLWLKINGQKEDKVYLEPVGYIGYFSEARMFDYPGLVSSEVVRLLWENREMNFFTLITKIRPDWIVLRPSEATMMQNLAYFRNNYDWVKTFRVVENLRKYKFIPGVQSLLWDAEFLIFKRKIKFLNLDH